MIDAGLTIESALRALDEKVAAKRVIKQSKSGEPLRRVIGLVSRGQSLSKALKQARCINQSDFTILNIAEGAGKLPLGLQAIAERRANWLARVESLKAGLLLPKGLLLLGAFAGIFVRIAAYQQSLLGALTSVSITLLFAWVIIAVTVRLVQVDALTWLSILWPLRFIRERWQVYALAFEDVFYRLLAWQVRAGVPVSNALQACGSLLESKGFEQASLAAYRGASNGGNIPNILVTNNLVLTESLKRVLVTSIETGSWDSAVIAHLNVQKRHISLKADDFFKWLPRVYYLIALLAVTKFMFV